MVKKKPIVSLQIWLDSEIVEFIIEYQPSILDTTILTDAFYDTCRILYNTITSLIWNLF